MNIKIITLFPNEVRQFFIKGIFKRALDQGLFSFEVIDLRPFGRGRYQQVDDYPFSEKKGMLLKVDVLSEAIQSVDDYLDYRLLYTCPKGPRFTQKVARDWVSKGPSNLLIIAGCFEGIDERLFDLFDIERVSLGDFVLSSGDAPALAITETILRLIPGVLGNPDSLTDDSIESGLLEAPHYTRPREFKGVQIPDIVVSGNHEAVENWKLKESLKQTLWHKPRLFLENKLDQKSQALLGKILQGE